MPMPSSALPASDMIVRTSAKSRLISPGSVIRSEMPCTPWRSTSSATRKASTIEVVLSSTDSRREFGITISVSTSRASSSTPQVGLLAAPGALEGERLGDDADGERADLAGDARHHGRRAGAGAAAGAGGDEDHVRALEQALELVVLLHRRCAAELGVRARAEPARGVAADVQPRVGGRLLERLHVGVDGDELHALDLGLDHAVRPRSRRRRPRPPRAARARSGARGCERVDGSGSTARARAHAGTRSALQDVLGDVRREDGCRRSSGVGTPS